jgi:hypothetical protein
MLLGLGMYLRYALFLCMTCFLGTVCKRRPQMRISGVGGGVAQRVIDSENKLNLVRGTESVCGTGARNFVGCLTTHVQLNTCLCDRKNFLQFKFFNILYLLLPPSHIYYSRCTNRN